VELAVRERPGGFETFAEIMRRADLDPGRARSDLNVLVEKGQVYPLASDIHLHLRELQFLTEKLTNWLGESHRANPFSPGVSMEEIRGKLLPEAPGGVSEAFFNLLVNRKVIVREGGVIRLRSFEPQVDPAANHQLEVLEKAYLEYGFAPPATSAVLPETLPDRARVRKAAFATLTRQGVLVKLDDLYHLHHAHFERAFTIFVSLANSGPVKIGDFRDALGASRKVALALMESFDRTGLTFKSEEGRLPRVARHPVGLSTDRP
jgi:selenocysteine-specific elongation factor